MRYIVYMVGGELFGAAAALVLFYTLVFNDMIGRGKGLAGIFDYLIGLIVYPLTGLILGALGGFLVARYTGRRQRSHPSDPHLLLKQLLADPVPPRDGLDPSARP